MDINYNFFVAKLKLVFKKILFREKDDALLTKN